MTAGIVDLSQRVAPAEITADVCIVGSGCAGATAAAQVAAAGHEVIVLEEGGDFTGAALTGRDAAMYDQLYMERAARATEDLAIAVLQGRVLGGGGVINACDVVPMADATLRFWQDKFALSHLTSEALAPHAEAALDDLCATRIDEADVNRANALLREGAEKHGLRGEIMLNNRVDCEGRGTCLIGCSADAKRNPRFVAIPRSIASGARYFTRARAVEIKDGDREQKRVRIRTLDAKGYQEVGEFWVRAPIVILAANAVASTQLLLRSGLGNRWVGQKLSLQPQLPVMAFFSERIDAFSGIPQAYAITELEEHHDEYGLWGARIEAIMGTPGIVASLVPLTGVAAKEVMARYAHMAAALVLVPDAPSGSVGLVGSGRPRIQYSHEENHKARARAGAKLATRIYLAAGAQEVHLATSPSVVIQKEADLGRIDALTFPPASTSWLSAHQQGGARMAASAKTGACNPDGQVYGCRDVYLFDSAWYPSSASSHTMAPIITLARYLSARLLSRMR